MWFAHRTGLGKRKGTHQRKMLQIIVIVIVIGVNRTVAITGHECHRFKGNDLICSNQECGDLICVKEEQWKKEEECFSSQNITTRVPIMGLTRDQHRNHVANEIHYQGVRRLWAIYVMNDPTKGKLQIDEDFKATFDENSFGFESQELRGLITSAYPYNRIAQKQKCTASTWTTIFKEYEDCEMVDQEWMCRSDYYRARQSYLALYEHMITLRGQKKLIRFGLGNPHPWSIGMTADERGIFTQLIYEFNLEVIVAWRKEFIQLREEGQGPPISGSGWGEMGKNGPKGSPGIQGEKGSRGEPGNSIKGNIGLIGPSGEKGDKGMKSSEGRQGMTGAKGDPGITGRQGSKGEIGPLGRSGTNGQRGPAGQPGRNGSPGIAGQNGNRGESGEKGNPGEIGKKGERGPPGVLMGGSNNPGEVKLIGPPGPKGNPGIGGTGEIGAPGTQGKPGTTGATGESGIDGAEGVPGSIGLTGAPGKDGLSGHPGQKGGMGTPGPKGENGLRGKPGPTGQKGCCPLQGTKPTTQTPPLHQQLITRELEDQGAKTALSRLGELITDLIKKETGEIDDQLSALSSLFPEEMKNEVKKVMEQLFKGFRETCGRNVKSWWEKMDWEAVLERFDLKDKMKEWKKDITIQMVSLFMPKNITIFTLILSVSNTIAILILSLVLILQTRDARRRRKAREIVRDRNRPEVQTTQN
jgi:hypothetical protein